MEQSGQNEAELRIIRPLLNLTIFITMVGAGVIAPFLPIYADSMGASGMMLGLIFSSFSAARIPFLPYIGQWSDVHGRKPFMIAGLVGLSASALAFIWAASPWQLVLIRCFQGVSAGFLLPVTMAVLADVTPLGQEGRVMAGFNMSFLLGWGLGPLLGGVIHETLGMKANFVIMSGFCCLMALVVAWRVPEPAARSVSDVDSTWRSRLALMAEPGLLGSFLARGGSAAMVGCLVAFLPVMGKHLGLSSTQVGSVITGEILVMVALQKLGGRLADSGRRVAMVGWGQSLSAVAFSLLPWADGYFWIMAMAVLIGAGSGFAFPALTAMTVSAGKNSGAGMGLTMSLFNLAFSVGILGGTVLGGWLYGAWRPEAPFYLASVMTLVGTAALILLNRGRPQPLGPRAEAVES